MTETTNIPCLPLKPETDAPRNPLYPRTTVYYNEKMNAVEVGFYGPDHGVIHILSLDRAKCLAGLLADLVYQVKLQKSSQLLVPILSGEGLTIDYSRVQRIMKGARNIVETHDGGAESWRTQGDGHYPTVEEVDHSAEYATVPREAEGA